MEKTLAFPDITGVLYREKSFDDIQNSYIKELKEDGSLYNTVYSNKLLEYKNLINNQVALEKLGQDFYELTNLLSNLGIKAKVLRRQKSYIGYNEKIRLFLQTGKPLSKILDVLGFRIIIGNSPIDDINTIKSCYDVMNTIINFFIFQKNCFPLEAEPLLETGFCQDKYPQIVVPKEPFLIEDFVVNVKDYIKNPKDNGYQSLHVVIHSPDDINFEIQIRTKAMDDHAEFKDASHDKHKNKRYPYRILFERERIHISGYELTDNGLIDSVGLEKSIDPFMKKS